MLRSPFGLPPQQQPEHHPCRQFHLIPARSLSSAWGQAKLAAQLLLLEDGQCGAWAELLQSTVAVLGCSDELPKQWIVSKNPLERAGWHKNGGMLIKNREFGDLPDLSDYPYQVNQLIERRGLPGQGIATPQSKNFQNHQVLTASFTTILDPSYGEQYDGFSLDDALEDWERESVVGFFFDTGARSNLPSAGQSAIALH